jgi:hypothetical protein
MGADGPKTADIQVFSAHRIRARRPGTVQCDAVMGRYRAFSSRIGPSALWERIGAAVSSFER